MVFRSPAADRAGTLQRYPQNNRESAFANVRERAGRICWRSPSATPDGTIPDATAHLRSNATSQPSTAVRLRSIKGLAAYRAGSDRPAQTQALHQLLERQHYRLAHWKLATSEINYRRFFDVNSLAGLRVEDRDTFDRVHGLVRRLIVEDKILRLAARSYRRIVRPGAILPASMAPDPRSPGLAIAARSIC